MSLSGITTGPPVSLGLLYHSSRCRARGLRWPIGGGGGLWVASPVGIFLLSLVRPQNCCNLMYFRSIKDVKACDSAGEASLIVPKGEQQIPPRSKKNASNSPLGSIYITNFPIPVHWDLAVPAETAGFTVSSFLKNLNTSTQESSFWGIKIQIPRTSLPCLAKLMVITKND